MLLDNDDDVDDNVNDENDAKTKDDRLKKKKDHVSTLISIELSDS
jgi:hypothetical protein